MTPDLALVIAARQRPAVVALAITADGSAEPAPRMFGLAEGRPPGVMVSEYIAAGAKAPFGRLHHFSLLSTERSAHALTTWATEPGTGRRLAGLRGRRDKRHIIDVFRGQPAALSKDRVIVGPGEAGSHEVSRQSPDGGTAQPVLLGRDELADLLTAMLTSHRERADE